VPISAKLGAAIKSVPRIAQNVVANAATTALMTGFQLLSVPVFLKCWGVSIYGAWIAINTLSSYFQMADVGLNTATANSLVSCYVKGDLRRFNTLLSNNVLFICCVFGLSAILLLAAILSGASASILKIESLAAGQVSVSLGLLFGQIFVGTITNVISGIYRAVGSIPRGIMIDNVIRAAEYVALLGGATVGLRIPVILAVGLAIKVGGLYYKHYDAQKQLMYKIEWRYLSIVELRAMWVPATSFFMFPIANAVALQGPVLLINYTLGSIAVVSFTTTRTLVNCGKAVVDILQKSIWPELSLAFSHGNMSLVRRLHRQGVIATMAAVVAVTIALILGGKIAYLLWTAGGVVWDPHLFQLFLIALASNALWTTSSVVLQSTNNHEGLALLSVLTAISCLVVSFFILTMTRTISDLPYALILSDMVLAIYVMRRSLILTNDSWAAWFSWCLPRRVSQ